MPVLYIVATPIGNLEDITLRALRVLEEVHLIAAEDTRTARKLLNRYNLKTPLTSYYEHNKKAKLPLLINTLKVKDIALISDAGTPSISDPGYELIRASIDNGYQVIAIPGCSAITTALVVSGLPCNQFIYVGFLPRKKGERKLLFQSITEEPRTVVCFESPHRLVVSLGEMLEMLGDRKICVCRELTKVHEEVFRGTISEAAAHFLKPRGEFTLVIEGKGNLMKKLRHGKKKFISGETECS